MTQPNIEQADVEFGIPAKLSWQLQLFAGLVTLALGIVLAAFPSTSLNVVCVIIGLLLILGGVFHFIRVLDRDEPHRVWLGVAGIVEVVVGVVLIRHLHLGYAVIGLIVGLVWIVQGVVALLGGIMGVAGRTRIWPILFGLVSIAAGIVVVAVPVHSVKVLAELLGIWFIIMGVLEIMSGIFLRSDLKKLD
jgi:uncharacterized membrane protein HdeD (DUF308 family)